MGLFAGIDVAKDTLAVAVSSGQEWSCANDPRGVTLLVERLEAANPALVVLEATGGYEEELLAALIAAGIEARRVNPREVHQFARAAGQLAKTDRIDARMLALFAEHIRPPARALSDPEREQLKALVGRRSQLLQMITAERNRRAHAQRWLARSLQRTIRALERELKLIDREIAERLGRSTTLKPLHDLITSLPGAGPVLAATLIARVPELRSAFSTRDRSFDRSSTLHQTKWSMARTRHDVRWKGAGARHALYGGGQRGTPQPATSRLLPPAAGARQTRQGCAHCRDAQAAHHPQCDAQASHRLERAMPRVNDRRVAHKSTGGIPPKIPTPVGPVGNAPNHLTPNTVALSPQGTDACQRRRRHHK